MAKNNQPKAATTNAGDESTDPAAAGATTTESAAGADLASAATPESAGEQLAESESKSTEASKIVPARVLAFCGLGEPNDVIEIDEALAETLPGIVDTTPEAVAYALSVSE